MIEGGIHRGSLVDLVHADGRRTMGRYDDTQASGPCVVALRRSSLADNGYRRVRPGDRVELCRVRP